MSTASLYCDDMITPNQYDELTLFLGCEKLSRKTYLVDISSFDINSILHGCHLYYVNDCHANTYIQNIVKDEALPKYGRTNMCFVLINEKEESSKVSSIISINKPRYVEKLPFKPLPPKEGKKKKRSKRREETVSSPKHVAPIIVFDESELDDVPMPVTYSSDHDWEKHTTFDIENLFGTNSENYEVNNCCSISAIHVSSNYDMFTNEHTLEDSYSIAYDDYKDEYDIFSHLLLRRKQGMITICLLLLMIMVMRIMLIAILLNLLQLRLLRMTMFMWGVLILLCIWLMIRMFYVIVILLILFMMLLKVIMREGNMVLCISILLSFSSFCWNS
jgi:hypothetical protein